MTEDEREEGLIRAGAYEPIDASIVDVCETLTRMGARTIFSCSAVPGDHKEPVQGLPYVTWLLEGPGAGLFHFLVSALPNWGGIELKARALRFHGPTCSITLQVYPDDPNHAEHVHDAWAFLRQWLVEVEERFGKAP